MIEEAIQVLREYERRKSVHENVFPDRPEIIAHATLSAIVHHWPSRAEPVYIDLLFRTSEIRTMEPSRWIKQRRIAVSKAVQVLAGDSPA